jgi:hypothetical protein
VLGFISAFVHLTAKTSFEDSLYTDNTAGFFYGVCGNLWFILTALGLLCWFFSLLLILPGSGKKRATGTILGILLPLIHTGFVMPTIGLVNPHARVYYKVSDPAAAQYLQEFTKSKEVIDQQFVKDEYEQDYRKSTYDKYQTSYDNTETIIVKYELRRGIERNDLPKSFTVIIDRKTKKTEIVPENDTGQQQSDK